MRKKEVYEIIDAEIEWCKKNLNTMPREYEAGFIKGLKQARLLIKRFRSLSN